MTETEIIPEKKPILFIEYRRVSTLKQKDKCTIKRQELLNSKFMEYNKNRYKVEKLFVDDGRSGFKSGKEVKNASVLDVIPTLLASLKMPIGKDMDGTIIEDAFQKYFLQQYPVQYINSYDEGKEKDRIKPKDISSEEEEIIKKKLKDLGYL